MENSQIIEQAYKLVTLAEPTEEVRQLLEGQELERVFELLLILRGWPNVRNPAGFLRRAIQEGWTPETKPQKVDRRLENYEERYYTRRGYTQEQAREMVIRGRS
ncbi:hypothetical protein [Paenibacillus macerans]|uniref:hypothetical protein n=1 Tax=Paenibacillus macerans TaxID=44252 RepID=UPI000EE2E5CA|nr:hypothetical protein [Paenibacillus macerans]GBK72557.1 hypothetical protein PbJCM17693_62650 [Paenibacillus macerans]